MFVKLEVKLLYNTAYYMQTDRSSSKRTNQTVEIALQFFFHAIENPFWWLKVLPRIQSLLDNTFSSTTGKPPNELAYECSLTRPLDLCLVTASPDIYVANINAVDTISFVFMNQKCTPAKSTNPYLVKLETGL